MITVIDRRRPPNLGPWRYGDQWIQTSGVTSYYDGRQWISSAEWSALQNRVHGIIREGRAKLDAQMKQA